MSEVNLGPASPSDLLGQRPRRHRTLAAVLCTVALCIAASAIGIWWLLGQHRATLEAQTAQAVQLAMDQANALREQARATVPGDAALWSAALAAAERVEQTLDSGPATAETRESARAMLAELRTQAADADKDRRMLVQLDRAGALLIDVQDSDVVRPPGRQIVVGHAAAAAYAGAFRDYGIDVEALEPDKAAERVRDCRIRPQVTAALDAWYFAEPTAAGGRLMDIAARADADTPASRVRRALHRKDAQALKGLADDAQACDLPASTVVLLVDELSGAGMHAAGMDLIQRARARHAGSFPLQYHAGNYLAAGPRGRWPEASRAYAAAITLQPANPIAWRALGTVLTQDGQYEAALAALQRSIELNPKDAASHSSLAEALRAKGSQAEALAAVDKALARQPDSPRLHTARGNVLRDMKRMDEAMSAYQQALAREPRWYPAHLALADVHVEKGEADKAMALLQQVERDRAKDPAAQLARWQVLLKLRGQEGTPAAKVNDSLPQLELGRALLRKGEFTEAHKALTQAVKQLDPLTIGRLAVAAEIKSCERLMALDKRLDEFRFRGVLPKSTKEVFALADVARRYKQHHFTAVALYGRVFNPEAKLVDELIGDHRYRAVCSALLAATGKALDLPKATANQKGHLRDQALRWLHDELEECTQSVRAGKSEDTPRLIERIARWQTDTALESVRGRAIDVLPGSEQTAWRELWDDADLFVKAIRAGVLQVTLQGSLTKDLPVREHEVELVDGRVYVFELESNAFDPLLKLQDNAGKVLSENDDSGSDSRNARIVFTAPANGVFRLVAASYRDTGTGPYRLRIAALREGK